MRTKHPSPRATAQWSVVTWLATAAIGQSGLAAPAPVWRQIALGDRVWSGHTHAATIGERAFLLHDRDIEVVHADGTLERWATVLPRAVDAFSAVATTDDHRIAVVPGRKATAFVIDPASRAVVDLPGLQLETGRGTRLVSDGRGGLVCMLADGTDQIVRYREGLVEALPAVETVNRPGKYSSGLFRLGNHLHAFGDHHVSRSTSTNSHGTAPRDPSSST